MPISESQKGRAVEQLVGATLLLQSDGALRVSIPLVDDEGVDLIVGNRSNDRSLLLQIKSRFSLTGRGHYRTNVKRATCSPNPNKHLLFVYYDKTSASLGDHCWLIAAPRFCELLGRQRKDRPVYVFDSSFSAKDDMWVPSRLTLKGLSDRILQILH
jgi:hypothetical protein